MNLLRDVLLIILLLSKDLDELVLEDWDFLAQFLWKQCL
jgi:hypothetical protein